MGTKPVLFAYETVYLICVIVSPMESTYEDGALAISNDVWSLSHAAMILGAGLLTYQDEDGITRKNPTKLGAQLDMSRTTVWRAMRELREKRLVTQVTPDQYEVSEKFGYRIKEAT